MRKTKASKPSAAQRTESEIKIVTVPIKVTSAQYRLMKACALEYGTGDVADYMLAWVQGGLETDMEQMAVSAVNRKLAHDHSLRVVRLFDQQFKARKAGAK